MTLAQLINRCRQISRDTAAPYLWSNEVWTAWLNEGVTETCLRAKLISRTGIALPFAAAVNAAELPAWVFSVRRVAIPGKNNLALVDRRSLDQRYGCQWETHTGEAQAALLGDSGQLCLYPAPMRDCTVVLDAWCLPETPMQDGNDTPEIPEHYHDQLVNWALYRAYLMDDADQNNERKATAYLVTFEAAFGPKPEAATLQRIRLNVRHRVTPQWM